MSKFSKKVKLHCQGHMVKNVGNQGKVLPLGIVNLQSQGHQNYGITAKLQC